MGVKSRRGGKRANQIISTDGQFGENTAGTPRTFIGKDAGTRRRFIGSDAREFTFYSDTKGTLTIMALTFEDALRQAKVRGYGRKDYKE